jgi:type IV secretory pathway ATPase VirB11/archaellum biosynthesis ATPase
MADAEIRLADQVANGTMSQEIADLLRDTATARKSFIVMAVPRLAGKTTTMRAMLAEQRGPVVALGYDGDDVGPLIPRAKDGYLTVPEISRGAWSAGYVWGEPVREAFAGIATGTALATALHAPDPDEAFSIICRGCGVPDADAARISVVVYLRSLGEWEHPTRRVVSTVHEIRGVSGGKPDARLLFRWNEATDRFERGA